MDSKGFLKKDLNMEMAPTEFLAFLRLPVVILFEFLNRDSMGFLSFSLSLFRDPYPFC